MGATTRLPPCVVTSTVRTPARERKYCESTRTAKEAITRDGEDRRAFNRPSARYLVRHEQRCAADDRVVGVAVAREKEQVVRALEGRVARELQRRPGDARVRSAHSYSAACPAPTAARAVRGAESPAASQFARRQRELEMENGKLKKLKMEN